MSDPRKVPGFKQKHPQDRVEMLLGAILDELIKANEVPAPVQVIPTEPPNTRLPLGRPRK